MSYSNYDLCHMFAQFDPARKNRCYSQNNVFFKYDWNGDKNPAARTLYSYGHHFAIARIDNDARGNEVCFFTVRTYSNTTAKHVSGARAALSHYNMIFCAYPDGTPEKNFEYFENEIKNILPHLAAARKPAKYISEIASICDRVKKYAAATGAVVPGCFELYASMNAAPADMVAYLEGEKKKHLKQIEQSRERVAAWERGENVSLSYEDTEKNVPLRIEPRKGYYIITTGKGVTITIDAARNLANTIHSLRPWDRVETGALAFRVRKVTDKYISVGCHTFKWSYIDKFILKLNEWENTNNIKTVPAL